MPLTQTRKLPGTPVCPHRPASCAGASASTPRPAGSGSLLLVAALWPTWLWMGRRMLDRSDDPLGLLALAALGLLVARHRLRLRSSPRLGWFALALAGAVAATAAQGLLPALVVSLLALLALAAGLAAFLPAGVASAPVVGLSVLALPLLASLQFYAGFPLRVVTAEASRWLLLRRPRGRAQRRQPAGGRPSGHRRCALLGRADGLAGLLHGLRGRALPGARQPRFSDPPARRRRAGAGRQHRSQHAAGGRRGLG